MRLSYSVQWCSSAMSNKRCSFNTFSPKTSSISLNVLPGERFLPQADIDFLLPVFIFAFKIHPLMLAPSSSNLSLIRIANPEDSPTTRPALSQILQYLGNLILLSPSNACKSLSLYRCHRTHCIKSNESWRHDYCFRCPTITSSFALFINSTPAFMLRCCTGTLSVQKSQDYL